MKIKEISINNFRCVEELTIQLDDFTVLIGKNGVGKSTVLHALNFFKESSYRLKIEDFYNRELDREIRVSIIFNELNSEEQLTFNRYIQNEELKVIKIARNEQDSENLNVTQTYHGQAYINPAFEDIRRQSGANPKKSLYNDLKKDSKYSSLGSVRKGDEIESILIEWEQSHPGELELKIDENQLLGWKGVGAGKLNKFTTFFFVPAVHEYSKEETEKSTYLKEILDLTIRKRVQIVPDLEELKITTKSEYQRIIEDQNKLIVEELSNDLSEILELLSPGCNISIDYRPGEINFQETTYGTELEEFGFKGPISSVGHGVQRTSFFTLLMYLGQQQVISRIDETSSGEDEGDSTDSKFFILFIIEEPELYQHPNRIRLIKKILLDLTRDSEDSLFQFQIICSSHSPYLIDIQDAEDIKILRKVKQNGSYKVITRDVNLDKIAQQLKGLHNLPRNTVCDATTLKSRLQAIMTLELSEGFFADKIVLVEGLEDKAVIQAIDRYKNNFFDSKGIVVIPVIGKNNLDRPALIFKDLGIPTYMIFDTDSRSIDLDSEKKTNTVLKTIMGEIDLTEPLVKKIEKSYASLDPNMTKSIKRTVGDALYTHIMDELKNEYEFKKDADCRKNYIIMTQFIQKVYDSGKNIPDLEEIIQKIYDL